MTNLMDLKLPLELNQRILAMARIFKAQRMTELDIEKPSVENLVDKDPTVDYTIRVSK